MEPCGLTFLVSRWGSLHDTKGPLAETSIGVRLPLMKGMPAAVTALIAVVGFSPMASSDETPSLNGTAWVLAALPNASLVAGTTATLRFEKGRASGSDGCNRFSAPYSTQGSAIQIGPGGASTQMSCTPEITRQAEVFMAALTGAKTWRMADGRLELLGAGAILASFAAQSQSLAGTSWEATGINNGKGGVASVVAGTQVTIAFADGGKVAGSAGCNRFTTTYKAAGEKLSFTPAAATRMMCAATGVMEQEHAFLKALESVATMRIEGDQLEMRSADGALAASFKRSSGS